MNISQLTPKQLQRLKNRMMNEEQRLAKASRKSIAPKTISTGLSKGQRRRLNARSKPSQSLPRGLPVPRNPAMSRAFPSGAAARGPRRMTIIEDEFIQNISGSTGFATTGFYMNPGQIATFPWLSTLAKQFEKYTVNSIEFYYKPLVSGFATNGQSGKVMLSFDYDASDTLPSSKIQVEDTHPHADCMPYEECYLALSSRELNQQDSKYVRPGMLPASSDIKTYDGGLLAVSTSGNATNTEIGELRVRYNIDLHVPVLESSSTTPMNFHTSVFNLLAQQSVAPTDSTIVFAPSTVNPLGITQTAGTFTLPAGNYKSSICFQTYSAAGDTTGIQVVCTGDTSIGSVNTYAAAAGVSYSSGCVNNFLQSDGSVSFTFEFNGTSVASDQVLIAAQVIIESV